MQVIPNKYLGTNLNRIEQGPSVLLKANNVRIDGSRIRQRNGQDLVIPQDPAFITLPFPYESYRCVKLFFYNNAVWGYFKFAPNRDIIGYFNPTTRQWIGGWSDEDLNGDFNVDHLNRPPQFAESQKRLLFASKIGILSSPKLSVDEYVSSTFLSTLQTRMRRTGCPAALPFKSIVDVSTIGSYDYNYLPDKTSVAYRHVWKYTDQNGIDVYGAVSDWFQLTNRTGNPRSAQIKINIPLDCFTLGYDFGRFSCQIYRTLTSTVGVNNVIPDPSDQMFLVATIRPTFAQLTSGQMLFTDIIPDSALQGPLYTNETQQGAASSRIRPPISKTIQSFSDCAFYGNVKNIYQVQFDLLSVADSAASTPRGLQQDDIIVLGDLAFQARYTPDIVLNQFQLDNTTGGLNVITRIKNTVKNIQNTVNRNQNRQYYNLQTQSGPNDITGKMILTEMFSGLVPDTVRPYIGLYRKNGWPSSSASDPSPISPTPLASFQNGIGFKIITIICPGLGLDIELQLDSVPDFFVGDLVNIARLPTYIDTSLPAGSQGNGLQLFTPGQYRVKTIVGTTVTFQNFTSNYAMPVSQKALNGDFSTYWSYLGACHCILDQLTGQMSPATSQTREFPARLMYSAFQQPENAPALNYFDVGSTDKQIIKIYKLNKSLFIFKQDGLYRLSGDYPNFYIQQFDPNIVLAGADCIATMGGSIFCLTTKGIYQISQNESNRISYQIQSDINRILYNQQDRIKTIGFAVGNDDDHSVTFWLPNYVINKSGHSESKKCDIGFVYDGQGWTIRNDQAAGACCGVNTNDPNDKYSLYTIKDYGTGWLTKQRKTMTGMDFCDQMLPVPVANVNVISPTKIQVTFAIDSGTIEASMIPIGTCVMGTSPSARAFVTGVSDVSVNSVHVDLQFLNTGFDTSAWSGQDLSFYLSFVTQWQYGINAGQDPTVRKHFSQIGLIYQQPYFWKGSVGFSSDVVPLESYLANSIQGFVTTIANPSNWPIMGGDNELQDKVIRTLVSSSYARCSQLRVSVKHIYALQFISCYGYFIRSNDGGKNIERNNG